MERRTADSESPSGAPLLLVVSGPSGVGKDAVIAGLRRALPSAFFATTVTTRSPRPGEREGVDYRFLSDEQYDRLVAEDGFLERAAVYSTSLRRPERRSAGSAEKGARRCRPRRRPGRRHHQAPHPRCRPRLPGAGIAGGAREDGCATAPPTPAPTSACASTPPRARWRRKAPSTTSSSTPKAGSTTQSPGSSTSSSWKNAAAAHGPSRSDHTVSSPFAYRPLAGNCSLERRETGYEFRLF